MITAFAMTEGVNAAVLALTPFQRWQAARQLDSSFMTELWFILTGVVAIIILTVLLIVVSYNHAKKERKFADRLFVEYADRRGLSQRERQILLDIATKAKLKRNESIFTIATAFDRGATKIIEESLALERVETRKKLNAELSALRHKLGFQKRHPDSIGSTKSNKPSSRQIPIGKKLHITSHKIDYLSDIESTVIKNDDTELTVKLSMPLETNPSELWCARYYFGASVWEFDTSVISCHGGILVLNHSDNVRFINRRRFLRVPVNKPALIARFPFIRMLPTNISGDTLGPPEFVPAAVTELGGPGLRLEAPLELKVGDRVVLILKMSERKGQISTSNSKIIEDIGQVRHTKATENGFSIAVELTGLSDPDVNELIRDTNAASLKTDTRNHDVPVNTNSEQKVDIPEPIAV